ncbi:MAG: NUDIX domain-containing protein, partial [Ilumatobacteraceae bacterium]
MRTSAGIVLHRRRRGGDRAEPGHEVLLGHMGGPYWARRDEGAWTIPKGEHGPADDPLAAACREFEEELGVPVPVALDRLVDLGEVRQSSSKRLRCWAAEGDLDVTTVVSNTFEIEWPPRSGRMASFPELDRAE